MDNYCVYKHTSPKGKVYIGITRAEPSKRWANGFGYSSNRPMFSDIVYYGWSNFKHEILFSGLTRRKAEEKEIELITKYNSIDCDYGYNQVEGVRGYHRPDHVKESIKKNMKKFAVDQYTLDEKFIATYESAREAGRRTGVHSPNIIQCCRGIYKTAGGYKWKFAKKST